jgi:hypothetical protein
MSTFHKIDKNSPNTITNALSFFDVPGTNVSIQDSSVMELLTLNPVNSTPYHFKIHASTNYVDLSKTYVFLECRIRKDDGSGALVNLTENDNVSVCQMLGHTIWKNCRVSINGTQIFEGNSLMAYKSLFDYELTYPTAVKNSYLSTAGYFEDAEDSQTTGRGHNARKALFATHGAGAAAVPATAQFIAKLDVDICNQNRYLVNMCEVDIELMPHDSRFLVVAPTAGFAECELEVLACKLYVKRISLMDSLAYDIAKKMEMQPVKYPIRKTSLKKLFISENRRDFTANLWNDQVPRRVILAMVSNADFVGDQKTSPFNFRHFDIHDISVTANGVTYPNASYALNFPAGKFNRVFHDMNESIGYAGTLESNGISMKKYANGGCCFFVFNLTSSGEDSGPDTFDLIRNGSTQVKISFNSDVPTGGIMLIAMGEVDSMLMMDRNRMISSDISV